MKACWSWLWQDLAENRRSASRTGTLATLFTGRYTAVLLLRLAQLAGRRSALVAGLLKQFNQMLTGADLAWQAAVGPGLVLFHPVGVVVGPTVRIGRRCHVQQGVTIGGSGREGAHTHVAPHIGDDVMIGAGAKCIGGVTIGSRANVGANAVVLADVPVGATAVGVPARIVSHSARAE